MTSREATGKFAAVTTEVGYESRRKHRHDLGHEDHGPVVAAGTTRAIQVLLGLWVLGTAIAVIWAMLEGGRGERDPGRGAATTPAGATPAATSTGH